MSQCHALLAETLGSMCEFMLKQTKERNMPWLLMIANNTLAELHRLRCDKYVNLYCCCCSSHICHQGVHI